MSRPLVLTALLFIWTSHSAVDAQILRRQTNRSAPIRIYRQPGNRFIGQSPVPQTLLQRQLPPSQVLSPQAPTNRLPPSSPRVAVPGGRVTSQAIQNSPARKNSQRPIVHFRNMPLLRLPDGVLDDPNEFYESIGVAPIQPADRPSQAIAAPNQTTPRVQTLPGPAPQLPVYEVTGSAGNETGPATGVTNGISVQSATVVPRDAVVVPTIDEESTVRNTLTEVVVNPDIDTTASQSIPVSAQSSEIDGGSIASKLDENEQEVTSDDWSDDEWETEDWAQEDWAKEEWDDDAPSDVVEASAGSDPHPNEIDSTAEHSRPVTSTDDAKESSAKGTLGRDSLRQSSEVDDWDDSSSDESSNEEWDNEEWSNEEWEGEDWNKGDWEGEDWANESSDDEGTSGVDDWDSETIEDEVVTIDDAGLEDTISIGMNDTTESSVEETIDQVEGTTSLDVGTEETQSASWQWILALGPVLLLPVAWFWWKRQRKQDDFISATARPTKDAQPNLIESRARPAQQTPSPAKTKPRQDDLTRLRGITPPVSALLNALGIRTFQKLSESKANELRAVIEKGGLQGKVLDPSIWIQQAWFAARDDWASLEKWQTMNGHLFQQTQQPTAKQPQPTPASPTPSQAPPTTPAPSNPAQSTRDDLTRIRGIDATLANHLAAKGISSFVKLAKQDTASLRAAVSEAGPSFANVDPQPWPGLAALASRGDWEKVQQLNTALEQGLLDTTNSIFETLSQAVRPKRAANSSSSSVPASAGTETTPFSEVMAAMGKSTEQN